MTKHIKLIICLICAVSVFGQGFLPVSATDVADSSDCQFSLPFSQQSAFDEPDLVRTSSPFAECEIIAYPAAGQMDREGEYLLWRISGDEKNFAQFAVLACSGVNATPYTNQRKCFYLII